MDSRYSMCNQVLALIYAPFRADMVYRLLVLSGFGDL